MAASTANGDQKEETSSTDACAICMDDIAAGSLVTLVPCHHEYCLSCINAWATTQHICPLCKRSFEGGHHFSDSSKPEEFVSISFASPLAKEVTPDFSCLDFEFFISMASRILQNIEEAQAVLFAPSGVFSARGGGTSRTAAREILTAYQTRLEEASISLLEENRFNAERLLEEMTTIDRNLQTLWSGAIPTGVLAVVDAEDYDEDYYEDDVEEDVHIYAHQPKSYNFNVTRQSDVGSGRVAASKFSKRKR